VGGAPSLEDLRQYVFFNPDPVVGDLVALTRSVADITLDAGANQLPHVLAVALFEDFRG